MKKILPFFFLLFSLNASATLTTTAVIDGAYVDRPNIGCGTPILFLGDSITYSGYDWREFILDTINTPICTHDAVGTMDYDGGRGFDGHNSGVTGNASSNIEHRLTTDLPAFFYPTVVPGGVVFIHAGTNDITNGAGAVSGAVNNVEDMIDMIHAHDPTIDVYVALVIPRQDANETDNQTYRTSLNTMLETYQGTKSNLYIVDMWGAFMDTSNCSPDFTACMSDNLHPGGTGTDVMGAQWLACYNDPGAEYCNGN